MLELQGVSFFSSFVFYLERKSILKGMYWNGTSPTPLLGQISFYYDILKLAHIEAMACGVPQIDISVALAVSASV